MQHTLLEKKYSNFAEKNISDCLQLLLIVFLQIRQNLENQQQKLFKDSSTLSETFTEGQLVLFYNPVLPVDETPIFHRYWTGPFVVLQKINPVIYEIQQMDSKQEIRRAHVSRLKLWFDRM